MRNERGQATLIELALVLPLLLVFVFGVVDYGRAMYAKNTLANAARVGARRAVSIAGLTAEGSTAVNSGTSLTGTAVAGALAPLNDQNGQVPGSLRYQVSLADSSGNAVTGTGTAQSGYQVTVTVTYGSFPMITPFNRMLAVLTNGQSQGSNQMSLSGQAVMRYE